jgi:hypothetical protein
MISDAVTGKCDDKEDSHILYLRSSDVIGEEFKKE